MVGSTGATRFMTIYFFACCICCGNRALNARTNTTILIWMPQPIRKDFQRDCGVANGANNSCSITSSRNIQRSAQKRRLLYPFHIGHRRNRRRGRGGRQRRSQRLRDESRPESRCQYKRDNRAFRYLTRDQVDRKCDATTNETAKV